VNEGYRGRQEAAADEFGVRETSVRENSKDRIDERSESERVRDEKRESGQDNGGSFTKLAGKWGTELFVGYVHVSYSEILRYSGQVSTDSPCAM